MMEAEDIYKIRIDELSILSDMFKDILEYVIFPKTINVSKQKAVINEFYQKLTNYTIEDINRFTKDLEEWRDLFIDKNVDDWRQNEKLSHALSISTQEDREFHFINTKILIDLMTGHLNVLKTGFNGNKSNISFKGTKTDFIELVVALHESDKVKRIDGEELTRKELLGTLAMAFNIDTTSTDFDNLLSSRTNAKKSVTPFLDCLKKAFCNYCSNTLEARESNKIKKL